MSSQMYEYGDSSPGRRFSHSPGSSPGPSSPKQRTFSLGKDFTMAPVTEPGSSRHRRTVGNDTNDSPPTPRRNSMECSLMTKAETVEAFNSSSSNLGGNEDLGALTESKLAPAPVKLSPTKALAKALPNLLFDPNAEHEHSESTFTLDDSGWWKADDGSIQGGKRSQLFVSKKGQQKPPMKMVEEDKVQHFKAQVQSVPSEDAIREAFSAQKAPAVKKKKKRIKVKASALGNLGISGHSVDESMDAEQLQEAVKRFNTEQAMRKATSANSTGSTRSRRTVSTATTASASTSSGSSAHRRARSKSRVRGDAESGQRPARSKSRGRTQEGSGEVRSNSTRSRSIDCRPGNRSRSRGRPVAEDGERSTHSRQRSRSRGRPSGPKPTEGKDESLRRSRSRAPRSVSPTANPEDRRSVMRRRRSRSRGTGLSSTPNRSVSPTPVKDGGLRRSQRRLDVATSDEKSISYRSAKKLQDDDCEERRKPPLHNPARVVNRRRSDHSVDASDADTRSTDGASVRHQTSRNAKMTSPSTNDSGKSGDSQPPDPEQAPPEGSRRKERRRSLTGAQSSDEEGPVSTPRQRRGRRKSLAGSQNSNDDGPGPVVGVAVSGDEGFAKPSPRTLRRGSIGAQSSGDEGPVIDTRSNESHDAMPKRPGRRRSVTAAQASDDEGPLPTSPIGHPTPVQSLQRTDRRSVCPESDDEGATPRRNRRGSTSTKTTQGEDTLNSGVEQSEAFSHGNRRRSLSSDGMSDREGTTRRRRSITNGPGPGEGPSPQQKSPARNRRSLTRATSPNDTSTSPGQPATPALGVRSASPSDDSSHGENKPKVAGNYLAPSSKVESSGSRKFLRQPSCPEELMSSRMSSADSLGSARRPPEPSRSFSRKAPSAKSSFSRKAPSKSGSFQRKAAPSGSVAGSQATGQEGARRALGSPKESSTKTETTRAETTDGPETVAAPAPAGPMKFVKNIFRRNPKETESAEAKVVQNEAPGLWRRKLAAETKPNTLVPPKRPGREDEASLPPVPMEIKVMEDDDEHGDEVSELGPPMRGVQRQISDITDYEMNRRIRDAGITEEQFWKLREAGLVITEDF